MTERWREKKRQRKGGMNAGSGVLRLRTAEAQAAALRASAEELGVPFEEYAPEFASFASIRERVSVRSLTREKRAQVAEYQQVEQGEKREEIPEPVSAMVDPVPEIEPISRLKKTKFSNRFTVSSYLEMLQLKYKGRLPYPEELRRSADPLERAFYYYLDENRKRGETPDMSILPKYSAVSVVDAKRRYQTEHPNMPRGELAVVDGATYKRLWRHKAEGALDSVPTLSNERGPWAGNAWEHYVSDHWGETRGEVNNFNNAFYKALQRQVLPRGFVLPDGSVLEKSCRAIEQVPLKRKRVRALGRAD